MKIILVNKFLFPKGGDAICTLETGKLLKSRGHDIHFFGMKHLNNPAYLNEDLFVNEMNLEQKMDWIQQVKTAGHVLYSLEAKRKVFQLIQRIGRPDIVHVHNFAHQLSPSILDVFKDHKIPVVMTMHDFKLVCASYSLLSRGNVCQKCQHGGHFHCFLQGCIKNSRLKSFLGSVEMYWHHAILRIYNSIRVFVSPSMFMKNKLIQMGWTKPVVYLPNCIDVDAYHPQYIPSEQSIVYVGRLSKEKGVQSLMMAVKGLDVTLKIIGEGDEKESLMQLVQNQDIHNVKFLGYKSGEDLKEEIKRSMFLVIASRCYENNPRCVIEAFALGKPVVGPQRGGIEELVGDSLRGLMYDPSQPDSLRHTINRLIEAAQSTRATMGQAARAFVEKELNAQVHYQRLMSIYQAAQKDN